MLHFFAGETQLDMLDWHQVNCVEVRLGGRKGDQR